MRKVAVVLLVVLLLTGCEGQAPAGKIPNTSSKAKIVEMTEDSHAKGYGDVSKIEIRKFAYNGEKIVQNRKLERLVTLDREPDIKKALDIYNSKVKDPGITDRLASDYRMDIVKSNGTMESYDFNIGEGMIVFFDNQGYSYQVRNTNSVEAVSELMWITYKGPLSQEEAISLVIKDNPDFPANTTDTITKELPTGGPPGASANVKFTTKAEQNGESAYMVTLTKDWGITVNGKYARSYWKYLVTSNSVSLIDSVDNDYLPNIMK